MRGRAPQAPSACYLLSVRTGPTVGTNAASINSHSVPTQTVLLISAATKWDGLYFPPCWGVQYRSAGEGSWQPVFRLTPFLRAHEYSVYSRWWSGWMVEHWRGFCLWTSFLPKINHHVGVTVTGNIGTVFIFFYLILRVCESVDFSKSVLDRRPRSWRRPGDTWRGRAWRSRVPGRHREEAVEAGEIVFICLSGSAPRSSGALLEGRALPAGEVMGVVAQTPPSWCAWWRNHLQRLDNNPNYQQAADRESCFQRIRFKSNPFVFGQTESPTHRKHVRTKRNMSRTFFFSRRESTSSSDLTQKTPNYQRRYLSSQRPLSADVINLSNTSARRQAWQPPPDPPKPP